MTEHLEIARLTFPKTQAIGGFEFGGLEGSSSTSSIGKQAPKRRKFNVPSMKGPTDRVGSAQNPLSLFNRVINSDLNPPQVVFNLPETAVLKVTSSKKRNNESACQINISLQGMEFGGKSDSAYKDIVGHGQILMAEPQYWKKGKLVNENCNLLMQNSQLSVFERGAFEDREAREHSVNRSHGQPLNYINRFLRSADKGSKFYLDAGKVALPEVLLSRFRPLGVVMSVGSTHFNTEKHTTNQIFGLARSPALMNYWLMCTPQPQAGVHLWFTLFKIQRTIDGATTNYFQFLPTTSLGHSPLPPGEVEEKSKTNQDMRNYLFKNEVITHSYQSLHIAKATSVALCKNAAHFQEVLLYFTRLPASSQRPGLQEISKATLYLRDALLR